jgi:hypothetical protein
MVPAHLAEEAPKLRRQGNAKALNGGAQFLFKVTLADRGDLLEALDYFGARQA